MALSIRHRQTSVGTGPSITNHCPVWLSDGNGFLIPSSGGAVESQFQIIWILRPGSIRIAIVFPKLGDSKSLIADIDNLSLMGELLPVFQV